MFLQYVAVFREKKEAEERRLRGEPDPTSDNEDTGNPFKRIDKNTFDSKVRFTSFP